ncbi:MAG: DinB family protein [Candidatus Eiseniibacteriota bacterium]
MLERTPRVIAAMLRGLPPAWSRATEGRGTWSPRVVVGHLVHGEETDWIPRARLILERGESRPFTPYDRFAQFRRFGSTPLPVLLTKFQKTRAENLRTLKRWRLTPRQLHLTGIHPEFGRVSLGQLLATWVAHDLGHVVQIARVMARRYQADAGPWVRYLSVLTRR